MYGGGYSRGGKQGAPAYRILQKALEEDRLPNVMMFYGSEEYLIRWITEQIVEKYVEPASKTFDYTDIDGFSVESALRITEACDMMPLMSAKRVVRVSNLNSRCRDLNALTEYLPHVPDSTVLIFACPEKNSLGAAFSKALTAAGSAYEFARVDRRTLEGFIKKYIRKAGAEADAGAVRAFADISGYLDSGSEKTLDNIIADIEKIVAHSSGRVTAEDISEAVMSSEERDVFAFTDALAAGDKAGALRMLRILLSYGGSEFGILGMICSQLETMMLIREAAELRRPVSFLEKELKINSYRIRLLSEPAASYTSAKLKEMLMKAYEIDRNVKTGVMNADTALELFVAGV